MGILHATEIGIWELLGAEEDEGFEGAEEDEGAAIYIFLDS